MSIAFHGNIVDLLEYAVDNNIQLSFSPTRHPATFHTTADTAYRVLPLSREQNA